MGYQEALEAAGAEVHAYEEFGSYQGDWYAKVTLNGETFWVHDYFGSCSACDAFEAEIGYPYSDEEKAEHPAKIKAFGERYLEPQERLTFEQALASASEHLAWDSDAQAVVDFINANKD